MATGYDPVQAFFRGLRTAGHFDELATTYNSLNDLLKTKTSSGP